VVVIALRRTSGVLRRGRDVVASAGSAVHMYVHGAVHMYVHGVVHGEEVCLVRVSFR